MAFPMIQFKATNTELDGALQDLVEQKLHSLKKFTGEGQDLKCEVEFEKVTAQQSGNVHRIEVNFYQDGKLFRAEATEESFEKAVDEVRNELHKEMRRSRKKEETLLKRGGRVIKKMMQLDT